MAVGDETVGFGGVFEVNDGVAGAFAVVPKVVSLGVPGYTVGTVESKRLDLTNAVVKHLATLRNGNAFTATIQHTNAAFARFVALRDARAEKQWRITVPDDDGDTEITVPGILTSCTISNLDAEAITVFEANIQISGDEI